MSEGRHTWLKPAPRCAALDFRPIQSMSAILKNWSGSIWLVARAIPMLAVTTTLYPTLSKLVTAERLRKYAYIKRPRAQATETIAKAHARRRISPVFQYR